LEVRWQALQELMVSQLTDVVQEERHDNDKDRLVVLDMFRKSGAHVIAATEMYERTVQSQVCLSTHGMGEYGATIANLG
jgi:DUF1009 family protein